MYKGTRLSMSHSNWDVQTTIEGQSGHGTESKFPIKTYEYKKTKDRKVVLRSLTSQIWKQNLQNGNKMYKGWAIRLSTCLRFGRLIVQSTIISQSISTWTRVREYRIQRTIPYGNAQQGQLSSWHTGRQCDRQNPRCIYSYGWTATEGKRWRTLNDDKQWNQWTVIRPHWKNGTIDKMKNGTGFELQLIPGTSPSLPPCQA